MTQEWKSSKEEVNKILTKIKQGKQLNQTPKISPEAAAEIAKHIRQLLKGKLH